MGQDAAKSDRTGAAEGTLATATQLRDQREKDAGEIVDQLEAARGELQALDALDKLTAEQHLASENARKRVKRLTGQLEEARAAVADAEELVAAAEHDLAAEQLGEVDRELRRLDADFIADVNETAERLGAKRDALVAKLAEAHALDRSLLPPGRVNFTYQMGPRGSLVALEPPRAPVLDVASRTLARIAVQKQAKIVADQHAAAAARGGAPYLPHAKVESAADGTAFTSGGMSAERTGG